VSGGTGGAPSGPPSCFDYGPAGLGTGGGLAFRTGTLGTRHTILAGNTGQSTAPDLSGTLGSLGYNLIGNTTGGSGFDGSDLLNVDPELGPLQDNGGPTRTHALLEDSPAIDAGDPDLVAPPEYDQRGEGYPRIVRIIDIGAFEFQKGKEAASPGSGSGVIK
jgi:hypothetical protein